MADIDQFHNVHRNFERSDNPVLSKDSKALAAKPTGRVMTLQTACHAGAFVASAATEEKRRKNLVFYPSISADDDFSIYL